MEQYLNETKFFNYTEDTIQNFLSSLVLNGSDKENVIALYNAIRDNYIYDPYNLNLTDEGLKASSMVNKNRAWCVEKATLLITCCRAIGVPARPGYAIVRNHIGVDRLTEVLKSDHIVFHGYADIYINGKWVKATPAFDYKVCRISGVETLDFDGENDSLFQEFLKGKQFMEYIHDYGVFPDIPIELMNAEMKKHYPHLFIEEIKGKTFSFKPKASYLRQQN